MLNRLSILFGLLFAISLVGCGGSDEPAGESDVIKIGHFASLTGKEATFGNQVDNGIRLAVDEINANGGVLGKQIELITEDNRSQVHETTLAVEKLIDKDHVIVLLGEVASSRSIAAAPIAQREKIPMVSPSSTNPQVTVDKRTGEVRDYVFRVCFIDPFQGEVMAKFAYENLGARRVAILKDNANDYSVGLAKNFIPKFTAMGGEIVEEQAYEGGQVDFKAQLTAIEAADADAIFLPGYYTEVSLVAIQAKEVGLDIPLLGGDGWDSPELTKGAAGEALEGMYFSNHYSVEDTSPRVKKFTDEYMAKYNELPGAMSALGYDAMKIVAKVIENVGKADPQLIRDGLEKLSGFNGVTGDISINEQHNADKPAVIIQIKDGKFTYHTTIGNDPTSASEAADSGAEGDSAMTGEKAEKSGMDTATSEK